MAEPWALHNLRTNGKPIGEHLLQLYAQKITANQLGLTVLFEDPVFRIMAEESEQPIKRSVPTFKEAGFSRIKISLED